ncbi:hypothetical protein QBC37DRAFT_407002 [Rhypophila decipiens]|uniref:Odorant receptor n=1 Tax=Rhypophila decipiens TaxID=261697 RepID=A0AAN7B1M5_9PEZI|nr:hypothetical protein QBC37DRAFT_407002 [Rhypophila decipiens]
MRFPHLSSRFLQLWIALPLISKAAASPPPQSLTAVSQVPQQTLTVMDIEQVMKCEFDTIKSLVDHVLGDNRTTYNVSFLIQTCPDVCGVVYGTGNPDISGVGAVVSYIIQGVSSLIFGPMLAFVRLYLSSSKSHDSYFTYDPTNLGVAKHFIPVSKSIHQANIMTGFAVLVAGVYRIIFNSDFLTVGENEFLTTLSTYQLLTCIVCTISYLPLHPTSILEKIVLAIYMLGTIALWFSIQSSWDDSYRSVVAMKGIALHCIQQTKHADLLRVGPNRLGALAGAFILDGLFSVFVRSLLGSLLDTREQLRSLAGEKYEDNDWGFGQITAVMTWVPVVQETGFAVFRTIRHYMNVRASRRRHGAAHHPSESIELLPSKQNSDKAEHDEGPGRTATPSVLPEDSDSDTQSIKTSTYMPSRTPGTTSSHARPDGATLKPRGTWPRNESDTYLPLRA